MEADIRPTFGIGRMNNMVTGELKSKIDSLWEIFWTGGLTNPLDVIEQMTYLMFIRDLDEQIICMRKRQQCWGALSECFCQRSSDW